MWACRVRSLRHLETLKTAIEVPWLSLSLCSHAYAEEDGHAPPKKAKLAPLQERRMIDRFRLYAKGGDGGSGCFSVRRSRIDRHGKPDGGSGGRGGDVILECTPTIWDFSGLQHHANAGRGGNGTSKNKIGTRGTDKVVHVPVGTVIHLLDGEIPQLVEKEPLAESDPWDIPGSLDMQSGEIHDHSPSEDTGSSQKAESWDKKASAAASYSGTTYEGRTTMKRLLQSKTDDALSSADDSSVSETEMEFEEDEHILYNVVELKEKGQRVIIARGGEGGPGNVAMGKLSKDLKPMKHEKMSSADADDFEDEAPVSTGCPGSESALILELKSIADVGLVGMPNAGKSTLLGAISRAKPTVGHYAFTTLRPNLGNVNFHDFSITVADIPGLIKGAHENRGLGHAFLRHIERTKVLAFVVDLASGLDGRKGIPPWHQLRDLILELEHHQEGLSHRPSLIVANKIDEDGAEAVYEELKRRVKGAVPIYPVCAVLEEGVPQLKDGLKSLVDGGMLYVLDINDIVID